MAQVAVLHNTLDFQGGADAVCLATCEALLERHEVTVVTIGKTHPEVLAERFGAKVDGLITRRPPGNAVLARALSKSTGIIGPQMAARTLLVERYLRRFVDEFDLVVSTTNELALPIPSVQYVHFPQFHHQSRRGSDAEPLNTLWTTLGGPQTDDFHDAQLLANSAWTASVFEEMYDLRPDVVHPPVQQIEGAPWAEREDGIVLLGRIAPDKNVLEAMTLIDALREKGFDLHLHIVGSTARAYDAYVERVEKASTKRAYVHFERNVPRDRIEELLGSHRYGVNLKRREHFGMSVAEYVSAGMIAFAPDSGGQREVLDYRSDRLFGDLDGAVETISEAIEIGARPSLPQDRFRPDRFKSTLNDYVTHSLRKIDGQ